MMSAGVAQVAVAIVMVGVPALLIAYRKHLASTLLVGIGLAALVFLIVCGAWLSELPGPAILLVYGLVLVWRWGWVALLLVVGLPGVPRGRRAVLAVVAACWTPFGAQHAYHKMWYLPPWLGPLDGYRVVRRAYSPDSPLLFTSLPFRQIEMHSADTRSAKATVLDGIERRLLSAGWERLQRAEGRAAVVRAIPVESPFRYYRAGPIADYRDVSSKEFAWFLGFTPGRSAATVFADPGMSVMSFTRGDAEYQNVIFLVYDHADGRTIECHLTADVD
jgi:hypothetical protein